MLAVMWACGDETPAAPTPTEASLTISVSPNPVTAVLCNPFCVGGSGAAYPFQASLTVQVQESNRIGAHVNFINVAAVTAQGAALPLLNYGADEIIRRSGTNHLSPAGTLTFPLSIFYVTGTSAAQLVVTISADFTDDRGNRSTGTAQVNVEHPETSSG